MSPLETRSQAPSLTYLSLCGVIGLKLYINASCLATFHERWRKIFKLFTSPAPSLVESTTKLYQEFGFPCINALFYARLASLVYIIQVGPHHIRPCYDCILVLGRPAMC